jgi:hypothetical protein
MKFCFFNLKGSNNTAFFIFAAADMSGYSGNPFIPDNAAIL